MKNIFKIMGIAVLACGMMVACNKPEEDNNNNNDNGGGNNNQQEQQDVYTLLWGGETPTIQYVGAKTNGQAWLFEAADHAEGNSVYFPYFCVYLTGSNASDITFNTGYTEVYEETYYTYQGSDYGDWQFDDESDQVLNVTALDATNYKMSANMAITFYSLTDYQNEAENIRTKVLNLTLTNYTFQAVSK